MNSLSNMAAWGNYAVLFSRTGADVLRVARGGSRWTQSLQQRSGFRKVARKPESKKVEDELVHLDSSEVASHRRTSPPPSSGSPRAFGRLVRPLLFTVGFTGCSFGSAAIWQYESLKSRVQSYFDELRADWLERVRPQKRGDVRKEVNHWWNTLSEGQRTVTGKQSGRPVILSFHFLISATFVPPAAILAVNAVVFCCWRVPRLQRAMFKYFTADPASKTLCAPMILSTFSHVSFFHMAANMYVLWSFSTSAVSMLGREQFVAVYLSAGVISTFFSYVSKMATGRFGPSLGASGAIMTILAAVCTKIPEAKLAIIFLPMFTFSAAHALKAIIAMDTAGLVLGWRYFDHAAHLGGALFGVWYILFGHELIWKNREPFVKYWHELRTGRGGGNGGEPGASA
ncbi:presenilin-associated rhomboid-like protein, mitochondrial [Stigmatopora argus]